MEEVFNDFLNATEELDEITLEGYFGEDAKNLVQSREDIGVNEYLYESLKLWIEDTNQYGKDKVKEYVVILFKLYLDAYKQGGQEAIDVMTAFWMGTKDNPELECFSAYSEFVRLNTETKTILGQLPKTNAKISQIKKAASSITSTYSKGVEFIGKLLTTCIILKKIASNETYNYYRIYNMTLFDKIKLFNSDSNPNHQKLTNIINRNLRNSEAHLSLNYDYKNTNFILKKKANGKIVNENISLNEMLLEIFPSVGWFTQAFVYSGILLVLAHDDKPSFIKSIKEIYGDV
ncbi:hypothetical protein [Niallia circulans]|uniref:Uncharacterized protein n=1 Tax=Niallia circulans TaxID=1397 RepID=A0A941JHK8_NIACI|nr:hypothetical protein [Niallia circulans]MCB5235889.1 hypothetical protein [Niallia circulans]